MLTGPEAIPHQIQSAHGEKQRPNKRTHPDDDGEEMARLRRQVDEQQRNLDGRRMESASMHRQLLRQRDALQREFDQLQTSANHKQEMLEQLRSESAERSTTIEVLQSALNQQLSVNKNLSTMIKNATESQCQCLRHEIQARDRTIATLSAKYSEDPRTMKLNFRGGRLGYRVKFSFAQENPEQGTRPGVDSDEDSGDGTLDSDKESRDGTIFGDVDGFAVDAREP